MKLKDLQNQLFDSIQIGGELKEFPFILESKGISRLERLNSYKRSSFLKTLSCLEEDFLMTKLFLKTESFAKYAEQYLIKYPADPIYLNEIGKNFPHYISENRPEASADFIVDIAQLEWLMIISFYDSYNYQLEEKRQNETRGPISINPSIQFLKSQWPLDKIWTDEVELPKKESEVCIWTTKDQRVKTQSWSPLETQVLKTLMETKSLEKTVETLAENHDTDSLTQIFSEVLPNWIQLELVEVR